MAHQTLSELLNRTVDTSIHGLRLAKPTGQVLEEDPSYIEVLIGEKSCMAKPCMPFGWYAVPSKEWWSENKDKWLVWVMPEMNNPAHWVWLGMCPLDDKKPENVSYPDAWEFKTRMWKFVFDDGEDRVTLSGLSGENKITLKDGKIVFGSGDESLILGDKLTDFLGQLLDTLVGMTVPTPTGGIGVVDPGTISNLQVMKTKLELLKSQIINVQ